MTGYFIQAFIFLFAAVVMVPLAKRLGLGSVLGYLIAGVIIGPVTGLVGQETNTIQHFAEFGVVMMLFLVGLELQPAMLWQMRHKLLGLGGLQVGLTTLAVTGITLLLGQSWSIALAIGLIFSLSSTAIVLQTFNEKGLTKTEGGNSAFSVLLFQDIAVIPMLALMPLLALPELQSVGSAAADHHEEISLVAHLPGWATGLVVLGTIVGLVLAGHYLSRPLFRYVADSGLREAFIAAALMLVIGIAALMGLVGLSPALGTFLAGVVLSNSEFRHELEANIEPFKGLLLGLFFITVGAGVNFTVLGDNFTTIIALTLGLMLLKAAVLFVLALIFKVHAGDRWLFTLSLAQAGEFGFVLLTYAVSHSVLPTELAQLLSLVVALSMFLTPALFIVLEKVIFPRYEQQQQQRDMDDIDEQGSVIIAGIGRFGQIVNRLLVANGVPTVVLDHQAAQVDRLRSINIKSFYGDATRTDLLHSAGIEDAKLLVVAIDDKDRALALVKQVKHEFPHVGILARAYDRGHHYELKDAGADYVISETYPSALQLGGEALQRLGYHPFRAEQIKQRFSKLEKQHFESLFSSWLHEGEARDFSDHYRSLFLQLESKILTAMKQESEDTRSDEERGWTPPPKTYQDDFNR
ncbi:monovalent cation:proton antiporter-2 (CPA2) family protein [Bacterioplanoides sp. SCSIO 12839]|uniref:monovalent cation:proton antiporter-2 (CPA2) family protein n=1 Tax=Bacterioplanoides sp. SCSIO 12839 TaxID=2829569 RepID=UPI002106E477|nr:monovalent cation:proton antiporter-2 (CPA2) family protein [Bacterioplanoides sp. SCSIO 12839]UTW47674.1 monovalent cation:proton antiporter-2 (CPA2) family protein [Bacterioplanoides sp. SCSIO 12839]